MAFSKPIGKPSFPKAASSSIEFSEISSGSSSPSSITIPSTVEVLSISSFPFEDRPWIYQSIRTILFESDSQLIQIESNAFIRFVNLKSICIPASVEIFGSHIFAKGSIETLTFDPGSKLTQIERGTLCGCSSLKSICIPASVERLGSHWFADSGIETVIFEPGSKLTRIENGSFSGMWKTKSIYIPRSVESLGSRCFEQSFIENVTF